MRFRKHTPLFYTRDLSKTKAYIGYLRKVHLLLRPREGLEGNPVLEPLSPHRSVLASYNYLCYPTSYKDKYDGNVPNSRLSMPYKKSWELQLMEST